MKVKKMTRIEILRAQQLEALAANRIFPEIRRFLELPANLNAILDGYEQIRRFPELPAQLLEHLLRQQIQILNNEPNVEPNRRRNLNLEKKTANENGEKCVICDENYKNGETICNTECNHEFHFDCLEEWIQIRQNCPLCRQDVSVN